MLGHEYNLKTLPTFRKPLSDKTQEPLTPAEFAQKYHWKNDPDKVRRTGE